MHFFMKQRGKCEFKCQYDEEASIGWIIIIITMIFNDTNHLEFNKICFVYQKIAKQPPTHYLVKGFPTIPKMSWKAWSQTNKRKQTPILIYR
jgi:hypothetical protein